MAEVRDLIQLMLHKAFEGSEGFERSEGTEESEGFVDITFFTYSAGIIIGITVVMIGWTFYGFLGAIHESKCMLGPYLLGMLVMFMVMTAGLSLGFFHSKDKLQFALEETMKDYKTNVTLENSTFDNSAKNLTYVMGDLDVSRAWDRVQEKLKCCGTILNKTYNSWEKVKGTPFPIDDVKVPKSCCLQFNESELIDCQRKPMELTFNIKGCFEKLDMTFEENKKTFLIVGLSILITMVNFGF